ncbi:MAG: ATP-binding protein [Planctomycetota bacterium]
MRINSLTTRFLLAILLFTTLPFLAFGWYVRNGMREELEKPVADVYLPQWAEDAALKICARLEYAQRAGWQMTKNAEAVLHDKLDADVFEQSVYANLGNNREFDLILLANAKGKVLAVIPSDNMDRARLDELRALRPRSVAGTAWFQAASGGGSFWVNRHLSPFLHRDPKRRLMDPTHYHLGLALPLQTAEEDGSYGALYLLIKWTLVQEVLDDTEDFLHQTAGLSSAEVFVCDADGVTLAHTDRQQYGRLVQPDELRETVLERSQGDVGFAPGPEQKTRHAGFSELPPGQNPTDFGWRIGLHATTKELFRTSRVFFRDLLLVIGLIAAILVGWALWASRAILRPVRRLSDATRKVAHGDLSVRVDHRGSSELSELSRDFNTMAGDLADSREKLRHAERQAAWAEMARQVAHEIKNPLTPMRMGAQLLLKARKDEDPRWESLSDRLAHTVVQQTDALDRIASDFRQFAGPPARELVAVKADEFLSGVEELVASMSEASGMTIEFQPGAVDVEVRIDRQEMRRVFLNLIHNATHACDGRGRVWVTSEAVRDADGAELCFRVADDGPGIPEELQSRLFEPYFTTKTSGTGLGLAICRRILAAHGGSITLESSAPGRTVFRMVLPIVSDAAAG